MRTFNWGLICGMLLAFGILEFPEVSRGPQSIRLTHRDVGSVLLTEDTVVLADNQHNQRFVGLFLEPGNDLD